MNTDDWKEITIDYLGKPVKGRYDVVGGEVTVIAWNGIKKAQLGSFPLKRLHRFLRELASES
jgi:hypothetical protein